MTYNWDFGDGNTSTATSPTYSYTKAGTYLVKLRASAAGNCVSDTSFYVTVNEVAYADFSVSSVCINMRVPVINRTRDLPNGVTTNYFWDFGNSITSNDKTPRYAYPAPGLYTIKLSVSTSQCPNSFTVKQQDVLIDAPQQGIMYPVKNVISYTYEPLQARNIGTSALWMPATSLNDHLSYAPTFFGAADQVYTIQLRTPSGCLTVDTQYVHAIKDIKIYVPNAFTPGNSPGVNDYLRPIMKSIVSLKYFRIYDRWGKKLFEMTDRGQGWDGRVNGELIEPQTVVWMLEVVDQDGVTHKQQGTTVVIR